MNNRKLLESIDELLDQWRDDVLDFEMQERGEPDHETYIMQIAGLIAERKRDDHAARLNGDIKDPSTAMNNEPR